MKELRAPRIKVLDELRGAALVAILLLHGVQHFDLYLFPTHGPAWLLHLDQLVTHAAFLVFFGKAYAVFALLFGVSYFIQERNNRARGVGHERRMLLRMAILFVIGMVHGLFYAGDILCILAFYGTVLTLLGRLNDRLLIAIAVVLTLQPYLLWQSLQHHDVIGSPGEARMLLRSYDVLRSGSLIAVFRFNVWEGRVLEWSTLLASGKFQQMGAWMMLGIVAGRRSYFETPARYVRLNRRVLLGAGVALLALAFVPTPWGGAWVDLSSSWKEVCMLLIYVSAALLVLARTGPLKWAEWLGRYGRMSLTNYVGQGLLGSVLFYGYGLGAYRLGATLSLLAAAVVLLLQLAFTRWWGAHYRRGPLEEAWGRISGGTRVKVGTEPA